ncbi:MAG: glucokinase [bacterium]|nr:glucokinase [bacterium]
MTTSQHPVRLVADIGGTHARFGLVDDGGVGRIRTLRNAELPGLREAIGAYLERVDPDPSPRHAAVAVAAPAAGDRVELTNLAWSFSIAELREELGLDQLLVINDFVALALALPDLPAETTPLVKDGEATAGAPLAVLGPGTGLGVAGLLPAGEGSPRGGQMGGFSLAAVRRKRCLGAVLGPLSDLGPSNGGWIPLATEGGHRDLAPATEREWQVCEELRAVYGHVSCERVLSGPGMVALYRALCRLAGREDEALEPREIVERADGCPRCAETLQLFCAQLGAVAGDLALTLGARGGVFVGGGIVTRMGEAFRRDAFVRRFEAKGRLSDYLRRIPVRRIDHPSPALLGAARALTGTT